MRGESQTEKVRVRKDCGGSGKDSERAAKKIKSPSVRKVCECIPPAHVGTVHCKNCAMGEVEEFI